MSGNQRVLILDDDNGWRELLSEMVEGMGFECWTAPSESSADALVDRFVFAVALLDLALIEGSSEHGGLRVLRRIRRSGDPTRIVVLTGEGDIELGAALIEEFQSVTPLAKGSFNEARTCAVVRELMRESTYPSAQYIDVWKILHPSEQPLEWQDEMMAMSDEPLQVHAFRDFLVRMTREVWPLVGSVENPGVQLRAGESVASGIFWSRRLGCPVVVLLGRDDQVQSLINEAGDAEQSVPGTRQSVSSVVIEGLRGSVIVLDEADTRSLFSRL